MDSNEVHRIRMVYAQRELTEKSVWDNPAPPAGSRTSRYIGARGSITRCLTRSAASPASSPSRSHRRSTSTCSAVRWPVSRCANRCPGHCYRRIAHGLFRTAHERPDLSFRSRQPIRQRRLPETTRDLRHEELDAPKGRLLGQRRGGRNAVRFVEVREVARNALCDTPSGKRTR
jgi:hypothetical protein